VTITSSNPQPGLGNATAINASLSGFSNGAASTNLIWNEVGTIDMNASMSSYLGWTLPAAVTGFQAGVGRFQPAYFDTTVTPGCATFTYAGSTTPAKAGQPFTVTVKAKRFGGDATDATNTANYAGAANAYLTTLSNAGVATGLTNNTILAANFANGVGSANVTYEVAIPETAPLTLSMRATNADPTPVSSSGHAEGTTDIRSGRAKLGNAHGSELLGLPVPFRVQYWSGDGWVNNSADTCSGDVTLEAGNAVSVALSASPVTCVQDSASPGLSGAGCAFAGPTGQRFKEGATPSIGFMGDFNLWLKAPGAGNVGAVTVTGNVPTWLQFAWGGGVVSNPTARATFGVYKGNNEFIYLRENY
jgi:MSHA biogenesis protein MshQ